MTSPDLKPRAVSGLAKSRGVTASRVRQSSRAKPSGRSAPSQRGQRQSAGRKRLCKRKTDRAKPQEQASLSRKLWPGARRTDAAVWLEERDPNRRALPSDRPPGPCFNRLIERV